MLARDVISIALVERETSLREAFGFARAVMGVGRRASADRFVVEIRDRGSGRLLAERGAGSSRGPANGLLLAMEADLTRLDIRAFTRRWGGRRPLVG